MSSQRRKDPAASREPSTLSKQGISRLHSKEMVVGNVTYKLFLFLSGQTFVLSALFPQVQALSTLGSLSLVEIPSGTIQNLRTEGQTDGCGVVWMGKRSMVKGQGKPGPVL